MKAVGYIRVSSLIQIEGESLAVQKEKAQKYTEAMGWEYVKTYADEGISGKSVSGRLELQKLLEDAESHKFDVCIVRTISRFGRNLVDCINNNKILADNNIKLISLNENVDFSSTIGQIILAVLAGFAELDNIQRAEASLDGKIKRAKDNMVTIGKMPYGRYIKRHPDTRAILSKVLIDKEKQKLIEKAAELYLAGERMEDIAKLVGITKANLYKIFSNRLGSEFEINFDPSLKGLEHMKEKIKLKIPALLDQNIIDKIHRKTKFNRNFNHPYQKHRYLLGRFVYCGKCGYACYGHTTGPEGQWSYYTHIGKTHEVQEHCDNWTRINIKLLDKVIMEDLINTFGDVKKLEEVQRSATANTKEIDKIKQQISGWQRELKEIEKEEKKLVKLLRTGTLTKAIQNEIKDIESNRALIESQIIQGQKRLKDIPTKQDIRTRAEMIRKRIERSYLKSETRLNDMSFEEKRELIELLFQGDKQGVYVVKHSNNSYSYEIKGDFMPLFGDFKSSIDRRDKIKSLKLSDQNELPFLFKNVVNY